MSQLVFNKFALVTGASSGIGAAVAQRLAADGASVLVHYASGRERAEAVAQGIRDAGGAADIAGADLSDRAGPAQLIAALDTAFDGRFAGRLDILVNNAGQFAFGALTAESDETFDRLFDLNVRAVFQLSREAARRMTATGWGRIVNTGSVFGQAAPMGAMGIYCATKFAIAGFTRAWSRDLGPLGITVNNVQPALVQNKPVQEVGPVADALRRFGSVGRAGEPADIAHAVAFLVSEAASYVNGASLNVDGGWGA